MENLVERFIKYVKIDTTSDSASRSCPSTEIQFDLAKVIINDMENLGLEEITLDENGYIMATLPANTDREVPVAGFIAHMDTAPSFNGTGINPRIVEDYDGKEVVLNKELGVILSPKDFPELKNYIGKKLIVTDGTTLLGADDKAGIVEILEAVKYLKDHPEIKHGKIRIGFTPDEEIGRGANLFNVEKFGADFAYTVDGGEIGELQYENFNAASAKVTIKGRNIHPGTSKNKMINSMLIGMELNAMLPAAEKPEYTEGYEGFYLLTDMEGDVEDTLMNFIIRDHSREKFQQKKELLKKIVEFLNEKYPEAHINLELKDSYYNMREKIEEVPYIVDIAKNSMEEIGINPIISPVRGGTDGARLSFMGLPCPNLFTGGHNFHGKFEYVVIESMEKAVELIVKIAENIEKM